MKKIISVMAIFMAMTLSTLGFSIKVKLATKPTVLSIGQGVNIPWDVIGDGYHGRLAVVMVGETPGTDVPIITPCYKGSNDETCGDMSVWNHDSSDSLDIIIPQAVPGKYQMKVSIVEYDSNVVLAEDISPSFEIQPEPVTMKWLVNQEPPLHWRAGATTHISLFYDGNGDYSWVNIMLINKQLAHVFAWGSHHVFSTNVVNGLNEFDIQIPVWVPEGQYYVQFQTHDPFFGLITKTHMVNVKVDSAVTSPSEFEKLVAGRSYQLRWDGSKSLPDERYLVHLEGRSEKEGVWWHMYLTTVKARNGKALIHIPKGAFNGTARITFYGRFIQGFESSTYTLVGGSKNPPPQIPGKG